MRETVNFYSPNLIKPKGSLGTQQNVIIFQQCLYFQPW